MSTEPRTEYVSSHRIQNSAFPQPEAGSVKVWRYLKLAGLVTILSKAQLPFIRLDLFDDPFEGFIPASAGDAIENPVVREQISASNRHMRRRFFVSCWHMNDDDSEAMWQLYCGRHEGVALRTTYEKLDASLPREAWLGKVRYEAYASTSPRYPINGFDPVMHKRPAFRHEQEVRAVIMAPGKATITGHGAALRIDSPEFPEVLSIDWSAEQVIEHVLVSPYAKPWFFDAVMAVAEKFAPTLQDRVQWSRMRVDPSY